MIALLAAVSARAIAAPDSPQDAGPTAVYPVPHPYRSLPDRDVEGPVAAGMAQSWTDDAAATLIHLGPFVVDQGALLGLPEAERLRIIEYIAAAAHRIASLPSADPATFERWGLLEGRWGPERCGGQGQLRQWFPMAFDVRPADAAPVPLKLLPSPALVRSAAGDRLNRARTAQPEALAESGLRVGRTLVYERGALRPEFLDGAANGSRLFRALPRPTPAIASRIADVASNSYAPQFGRLVLPNTDEAWQLARRAFHPKDVAGSRFFGEVRTVELLPEVHLRRVLDAEGRPIGEPTIVYELWDALQGLRCDAPAGVDPFAVPATLHGPTGNGPTRLGSHDLARVPLPLPSLPRGGSPLLAHPQERIAVDESWAAAPWPVLAVRKGDGWAPYAESLRIEQGLAPASARDGSLLMLGVFSTIAPEQLVEFLAAAAGVDPAPIKADGGFMVRLRELAP